MWNWLKKLFTGIKAIFVRTGLDKFVKANFEKALVVVGQVLADNPGKSFHELRDLLFAALKKATLAPSDNWVAFLLALVIEHFKASIPGVARTEIK